MQSCRWTAHERGCGAHSAWHDGERVRRRGTPQLVTATGSKGKPDNTQTGIFNGALLTTTRSAAALTKGLTTLTLLADGFPGAPSYANPKRPRPPPARPAPPPPSAGRPSCTTPTTSTADSAPAVRYSAGTNWDTTDECDTLTAVHRDTVDVLDFSKRKTITVHAGHSYLARAPRRRKK